MGDTRPKFVLYLQIMVNFERYQIIFMPEYYAPRTKIGQLHRVKLHASCAMNTSTSTYSLTLMPNTTNGAVSHFYFTGKERDEETGYGYFGARYMDHELMTMWLSVDPMSDKYPSISPYAYCAWNRPTGGHEHRLIKSNLVNNPVKLVDPDGRKIDSISMSQEVVLY